MPADRDRLRAYYASLAESDRLDGDEGWLERVRTLSHLADLPPCRILDLGGAAGAYALPLARAGHDVTLVDLSPELVALAQSRFDAEGLPGTCRVGDAVDLPDPGPFDAVLCAGPLYHVDGLDEAARVLDACAAVLVEGGRFLGAFLPRASGVAGLLARAAATPEQVRPGTLTEAWRTGRFANPSPDGFGEAYFAEPRALEVIARRRGLGDVRIASIRGLAASHAAAVRQLHEAGSPVVDEVLALLDATEGHAAAVHQGRHALLLATRASGPSWCERTWEALHRDDLHALAQLRQEVFVVEQDCPYLDLDGRDPEAVHLLGFDAEGLVAHARLFGPPDAAIGRVVVHPRARGTGLGRTLMVEARQRLERRWGEVPIHVGAQAHLADFYGSLGYDIAGPGYDEDGIPHLPMRLR